MCYIELCLLQTPETPQCWANSQTLHCFPCPWSLWLGCLGSARLPCVFWADSWEIKSSCQISSLPTEQAVGTSISLQTAARSCSWLLPAFCVPLEPPPATDLVLWRALTQGEAPQRCGLRQCRLSRERSCFSGEEVHTGTHLPVPDRAQLSCSAVAFPRPGEMDL